MEVKYDDAEWRRRLSPEQYRVLRREGTEPAFTSPLNDEKRRGTFCCAGCGRLLFNSDAKFDSGTGWPSFFQAMAGAVETKRDWHLVLPRTEYHCSRCGGHQGHVSATPLLQKRLPVGCGPSSKTFKPTAD